MWLSDKENSFMFFIEFFRGSLDFRAVFMLHCGDSAPVPGSSQRIR